MKYRPVFPVALVLAFGLATTAAAGEVHLTGVVSHSDGSPARDAEVVLDLGGEGVFAAKTNSHGSYVLDAKADKGKGVVFASTTGCQSRIMDFDITMNSRVMDFDITMNVRSMSVVLDFSLECDRP